MRPNSFSSGIKIWAHQGTPALYPENSWIGFAYAAAEGVDAVACDVQLTADGEAVLFHDRYLDRVTNACGLFADYTWPELAGIRLRWPQGHLSSHKLVRLPDLLRRMPSNTRYCFNLQSLPVSREKMVSRIRDLIHSYLPETAVELSSSDPATLLRLAEIMPRIPTHLILDSFDPSRWPALVNLCRPAGVSLHYRHHALWLAMGSGISATLGGFENPAALERTQWEGVSAILIDDPLWLLSPSLSPVRHSPSEQDRPLAKIPHWALPVSAGGKEL